MKNIRVIVFDLDDTLYAERDYAVSGLKAAAAFANVELGLPDLQESLLAMFSRGRRGDLFQEALRLAGITDPDGTATRAMVSAYRHHVPALKLFPDVSEVLPRLARLGRLGVLTDGYLPPQRLKVEALGLHEALDPVVYTEALGREHWKPAESGFRLIESICEASPAECLYIADNPRKDFIAPRRRGWTTIRVRRPDTEHGATDDGVPAEMEMSDFGELERWLYECRRDRR